MDWLKGGNPPFIRQGRIQAHGQTKDIREAVEADLEGNTITLTGHVRARAECDAVVDAARMADGVIEVRDDLYITG